MDADIWLVSSARVCFGFILPTLPSNLNQVASSSAVRPRNSTTKKDNNNNVRLVRATTKLVLFLRRVSCAASFSMLLAAPLFLACDGKRDTQFLQFEGRPLVLSCELSNNFCCWLDNMMCLRVPSAKEKRGPANAKVGQQTPFAATRGDCATTVTSCELLSLACVVRV